VLSLEGNRAGPVWYGVPDFLGVVWAGGSV
jgi:hypothetical protein